MNVTLAWVTIALLAVPIVISPYKGFGRVLSASGIGSLMLIAIFGARPIALHHWGVPSFYGYDVSGELGYSQKVAIATAFAWTAGVLAVGRGRGRDQHNKVATKASRPHLASASLVRIYVLAVAGVFGWLAALLASGGAAGVVHILAGRSASNASTLDNLPTFVLVLPVLGSAAATVFITTLRKDHEFSRAEVTALLSATALSILANVVIGNRKFIVPSALAPLAALVFLRDGRLPRKFFPLIPLSVLILAVIPFVRSTGARKPGQSLASAIFEFITGTGLLGVLRDFLTSFDTEMYSYIALVGPRLGQAIPYGDGRGTLLEAVLYPLPSRFVPPVYSDHILTTFFGGGCNTGVCPVASASGTFLFDFGIPGVLVGLFALGYLFRRLEVSCAHGGASPQRLQVLALLSSFSVVILRTNSVDAGWWFLYSFALVLFARRVLTTNVAPERDFNLAIEHPHAVYADST